MVQQRPIGELRVSVLLGRGSTGTVWLTAALSLGMLISLPFGSLRANETPQTPQEKSVTAVDTSAPRKIQWSVQIAPSYFLGRNDIHDSALHPTTGERSANNFLAPILDSEYASLYLYAGGQVPYEIGTQSGSVHIHLDTGEIYRGPLDTTDSTTGTTTTEETVLSNEQTLGDEFSQTYFVRQLFIEHAFGTDKYAVLSVGKGNPVVGYGLIYNDYSPFLRLNLGSRRAWTLPMELDLIILSPGTGFLPEGSLISSAEWAITHPSWGRISLFGALLNDQTSSLAGVFQNMVGDSVQQAFASGQRSEVPGAGLLVRTAEFSSTGSVQWAGAGYQKEWSSGHSVWVNGSVSWGQSTIEMDVERYLRVTQRSNRRTRNQPNEVMTVELESQGYAGQTGGSLFLGGDWYVSAFAVGISGDDGLSELGDFIRTGIRNGVVEERLGAFISIVPYLAHTNIFFNGGLDQGFSSRETTLGGLAGRGVLAAGLSFTGTIWGPLSYTGGPAILQSMHAGPLGRGDFYGVELDTLLSVAITDVLHLSLQVDVLRTGDFFPENTWNTQTTLQLSYAPHGTL